MDHEPQIGSPFGDFELVELLHRGPRASVYRANHPSFGRDVAAKIVRADDEPLLTATGAMNFAHPGLVSVYGHGRVDEWAWLAMQLITGVPLSDWWAHTLPNLRDVCTIVSQVASTLDALTAAGLAHGDVKPHNILLTTAAGPDRWRTYLIDPVPADSGCLTLDYAAPERLQGGESSAASDQYSLAAVAYHCLVGVPPFSGKTEQETIASHLTSRLAPLQVSGVVRDWPLALALDVVLRVALARNPLHRFASCSALAAALDETITAATVTDATAAVNRPGDSRSCTTATPLTGTPRAAPNLPLAYPAIESPTGYGYSHHQAVGGGSWQAQSPPPAPSYNWFGDVVTPGFGVEERPEWAMLTCTGPMSGEGVLLMLRITSGAVAVGAGQVESAEDYVDVSVFAPRQMNAGSSALVQVFVHLPEVARAVAEAAAEFDEHAERRGVQTLEVPIRRGAPLTFDLGIRGIDVPDPVQQLTWRGKAAAVQFEAVVPDDMPIGRTTVGTLRVSRQGIPIGLVRFSIGITADASGMLHEAVGDEARRFRRAFVSYASADRAGVLERMQVLRAASIDYFQDVDLEPGQRWEQELYRQIDTCDLFLLFWSQAAKDSTWVRKEVGYALDLGQRAPEIRPVVIEGPPVPQPWEELSHLHFNDRLLALLAVAAQG